MHARAAPHGGPRWSSRLNRGVDEYCGTWSQAAAVVIDGGGRRAGPAPRAAPPRAIRPPRALGAPDLGVAFSLARPARAIRERPSGHWPYADQRAVKPSRHGINHLGAYSPILSWKENALMRRFLSLRRGSRWLSPLAAGRAATAARPRLYPVPHLAPLRRRVPPGHQRRPRRRAVAEPYSRTQLIRAAS